MDIMASKLSFSANSAEAFMLSPVTFAADFTLASQSMGSRGSIMVSQGQGHASSYRISSRGRHAAGGAQEQQSQHDTSGLLAAIVDGAMQAAAAPGMLSVSAAGPQQMARSGRSGLPVRAAASSMLDGPSLLDLHASSHYQGSSEHLKQYWWPASPQTSMTYYP
jgi:hypothetical protein